MNYAPQNTRQNYSENRRGSTPTMTRANTCRTEIVEGIAGASSGGVEVSSSASFGQFILDAFCVEYQLEVGVDGGIHTDAQQAAHDVARTEFLEAHGIQVLRFSNDEVEKNLPLVLRRIVEVMTSPPSPLSRNDSEAVLFRKRGSRRK